MLEFLIYVFHLKKGKDHYVIFLKIYRRNDWNFLCYLKLVLFYVHLLLSSSSDKYNVGVSQHLFTYTLPGKPHELTHKILKTALEDEKNEALSVFQHSQSHQVSICLTLKPNYFYHITEPPLLIEPEA